MSMGSKLELLKETKSTSSIAYKRLESLFDESSFVEIDAFAKSGDGKAEAIAGYGTVLGVPVFAFSQDPEVAGGAMSKAQAAKMKKIYDLAVKTGAPVIGIYDSKGGRLNEGNEMLDAFGDILLTSNNLSGVVPQISLVLGTCLGASSLIASSADIVITSEKASFGIETDGKYKAQDGCSHLICKNDDDAIQKVKEIIVMLPENNLSTPFSMEFDEPNAQPLTAICNALDVSPETSELGKIINSIVDADTFIEFQAGYGNSAVVGLARVEGSTVGIVAFNGKKIDGDTCSKTARQIRFCDAFSIPVITFVDSTGFETVKEAAKLAHAYAEATTVKVSIIIGAAYGSVYIATAGKSANADITLAWPSAVISALNPTAASVIFMADKSKSNQAEAEKEYKDTIASAFSAAAEGFIDSVIDPVETRSSIISALNMLAGKRVTRLAKKHSNIQL